MSTNMTIGGVTLAPHVRIMEVQMPNKLPSRDIRCMTTTDLLRMLLVWEKKASLLRGQLYSATQQHNSIRGVFDSSPGSVVTDAEAKKLLIATKKVNKLQRELDCATSRIYRLRMEYQNR